VKGSSSNGGGIALGFGGLVELVVVVRDGCGRVDADPGKSGKDNGRKRMKCYLRITSNSAVGSVGSKESRIGVALLFSDNWMLATRKKGTSCS
jgi:hypothetical protein